MKLIELFPKWLTGGGIFVLFNNPPWADDVESSALDVEYFGNRSGEKLIAPLLNKLIDQDSKQISDDNKQKLVKAIWARFGKNWVKLYNTLKEEYDPIENYNMKETETYSSSDKGSLDRSDKVEYGKTVNTTTGQQSTSHDQYYGFNVSSTGSGKNTNGSDANVSGQGSNTEGGQDTTTGRDVHNYDKSSSSTLTRSGNIGVTTTQQMLESERKLWLWNYFDAIFADVDSMLVLQVFGFDSCCYEYANTGEGSTYVLPTASSTTLGGVKIRGALSVANHYAAIDEDGYVKYQYPGLASFNNYGLVRPVTKTGNMSQAVGVDEFGQLYTAPGEEPYVLPVASSATLGGVMPVNKTSAMSQAVGVDGTGKLFTTPGGDSYVLPVASSTTLGGVMPVNKTSAMSQAVGVDGTGKLFTTPGGDSYVLPVASSATLGGVRPVTKTSAMSQAVGVDAAGRLYTAPGSGGEAAPFLAQTWHIAGGQTVGAEDAPLTLNISGVTGNWNYAELLDKQQLNINNAQDTYMTAVLYLSGNIGSSVVLGLIDVTEVEAPIISYNLSSSRQLSSLSVSFVPLNIEPGTVRLQLLSNDATTTIVQGSVTFVRRIIN